MTHNAAVIDVRLDRPPPPLDWRFGLGLALAFLATLLPRVVLHEMWRDEWHTWLMCRDTPTLASLFDRIRYDGHPATWYVLVWLVTRAFEEPLAMQLIHAAIATAAVAVIGVAAPFARWQRVLLAFGYFFAFEYAVISRNYSLGALGLLLAAACHARAPMRPIATCAALALAVHSNAFAAIAACVITAGLALRWLANRRVGRASLAAGLAIVAASVALVAYENRPPADLHNTPWRFDVDVRRAGQLAAALWRCFVPLPSPVRGWWGTNVLDGTLFHRAQALLGLAVLWLTFRAVARDRWLRWLWLATVGLTLAFAYAKITGSLRHHGTLFVAFVALRWIDRGAHAPSASRGRPDWFWRATLVVHVVAALIVSAADVALPFTAAPATAAYIRANHPDAQLITQRDFEGGPLAGELGRPVYFPVPGRWGTYVIYNDQRSPRASPERLAAAAAELHAADPARPILLAVSDDSDDRPSEEAFEFIRRFDRSAITSERYNLFAWRGPSTTRPAAGEGRP